MKFQPFDTVVMKRPGDCRAYKAQLNKAGIVTCVEFDDGDELIHVTFASNDIVCLASRCDRYIPSYNVEGTKFKNIDRAIAHATKLAKTENRHVPVEIQGW